MPHARHWFGRVPALFILKFAFWFTHQLKHAPLMCNQVLREISGAAVAVARDRGKQDTASFPGSYSHPCKVPRAAVRS